MNKVWLLLRSYVVASWVITRKRLCTGLASFDDSDYLKNLIHQKVLALEKIFTFCPQIGDIVFNIAEFKPFPEI